MLKRYRRVVRELCMDFIVRRALLRELGAYIIYSSLTAMNDTSSAKQKFLR